MKQHYIVACSDNVQRVLRTLKKMKRKGKLKVDKVLVIVETDNARKINPLGNITKVEIIPVAVFIEVLT